MDGLLNKDPFRVGFNIYINWSMKKKDRQELLKKVYKDYVNMTNIYTKNLKENVTQEKLHQIFSIFGKIQSMIIRKP